MMNKQPLKIYIFFCSSRLDAALLKQRCHETGTDILKTVSLPCSGKVELIYLLKAFETDADGALLVTCQEGECRYLEGNLRARKRGESVAALLEEIGLGPERMKVIRMNDHDGVERVMDEVEKLSAAIRAH